MQLLESKHLESAKKTDEKWAKHIGHVLYHALSEFKETCKLAGPEDFVKTMQVYDLKLEFLACHGRVEAIAEKWGVSDEWKKEPVSMLESSQETKN